MDWVNSIKLDSSDIRKKKLQKQVSQLHVVVYYGVFLLVVGFILNTSVLYQILSIMVTDNLQQNPLFKGALAVILSSIGIYMVKALLQFWNLNLYVNLLHNEHSGEEWPGSIVNIFGAILYASVVGILILDVSQITPQQNLHKAFIRMIEGEGTISFLVAGIHHLILGSSIVLFFAIFVLIFLYLYPWQMGVRTWYRRNSSTILKSLINLDTIKIEACEQCQGTNFQLYNREDKKRVICNYCGLEKENILINFEEDSADSTTIEKPSRMSENVRH